MGGDHPRHFFSIYALMAAVPTLATLCNKVHKIQFYLDFNDFHGSLERFEVIFIDRSGREILLSHRIPASSGQVRYDLNLNASSTSIGGIRMV